MKPSSQKQVIIVISVIFVVVMAIAAGYGIFFGDRYKKNISTFEAPTVSSAVNLEKSAEIQRITVSEGDIPGCTEMTPDGQVRIYSECEERMETAFRTTNSKGLNYLFDMVTRGNLSQEYIKDATRITVYTSKGSVTYYIPNTGSGSGSTVTDQIINIIDDIIHDAPENSPTPTRVPTAMPTMIILSPSPVITRYLMDSPTPTAVPGSNPSQPFSCDFEDSTTGKKPYRVSNVVCTTDPK